MSLPDLRLYRRVLALKRAQLALRSAAPTPTQIPDKVIRLRKYTRGAESESRAARMAKDFHIILNHFDEQKVP